MPAFHNSEKPRLGRLWKEEGLLGSESWRSSQCHTNPREGDARTAGHPPPNPTHPPWSGDPERGETQNHPGGCANPRETKH